MLTNPRKSYGHRTWCRRARALLLWVPRSGNAVPPASTAVQCTHTCTDPVGLRSVTLGSDATRAKGSHSLHALYSSLLTDDSCTVHTSRPGETLAALVCMQSKPELRYVESFVEVCDILDGHARACLAMCTASICSSHLATVSINMLLQQATLLEKPTDVNAFARKELLHKARAQASPHRERQVHMLIHVVLIVLPAFSGPSGQGCRLPRPASGKTTRFSDFQRTGLSPWGARRVISECHFAVQLNNFIPVALSYSVAAFLT